MPQPVRCAGAANEITHPKFLSAIAVTLYVSIDRGVAAVSAGRALASAMREVARFMATIRSVWKTSSVLCTRDCFEARAVSEALAADNADDADAGG